MLTVLLVTGVGTPCICVYVSILTWSHSSLDSKTGPQHFKVTFYDFLSSVVHEVCHQIRCHSFVNLSRAAFSIFTLPQSCQSGFTLLTLLGPCKQNSKILPRRTRQGDVAPSLRPAFPLPLSLFSLFRALLGI